MTLAEASHLSTLDQRADDGLICGYHFDAAGTARALNSTADAAQLMGSDLTGFVWLHMNLSHTASLRWLRGHAGLSDSFFDALVDGSRSARIERDEDALFAVLNDVTFDFSFDAQEVETLWVSVSRRLIVSARRRPLRSVDRLRTAVRRGVQLQSSVDLLDHLLRDQADELQRILRRASERLDDIEDEVLAGRHQRHGTELAGLRRLMVRLQRLLTPEPSALARVLARHKINLQLAKIATLGERVDDTFLIQGAELQHNRTQIAIETELLEALA